MTLIKLASTDGEQTFLPMPNGDPVYTTQPVLQICWDFN